VTAEVPGLWDDMRQIDREEIMRRVDQIEDERLLPEPALLWLRKAFPNESARLWRIEEVIEQLVRQVPNIPVEMLAECCDILGPELYGEPPRPPRASHALPHSRARIAAFQRRHTALHGLWHPDDSFVDSVSTRQQELFLFSEIIEASEKIERVKLDIIRITDEDIG
jgi:hypothetical protein